MNIDKQKVDDIISEWFLRLPNGYANVPYTVEEYKVLKTVLAEKNIKIDTEVLLEAKVKANPGPIVSEWKDAATFEKFLRRYIIGGQEVKGLPGLYTNLSILSPAEQKQCVKALKDKKQRSVKSFTISGVDKLLFDAIYKTVKVTGGHVSEFWYAVVMGGVVKGGTAGDSGITSDVDVGSNKISLKNYKSLSGLDFGSLGDAAGVISDMKSIIEMVTDVSINTSMTRNSIDKAITIFKSTLAYNNISDLMALDGKGIAIVQREINKLKRLMSKPGDIGSILKSLFTKLDALMESKLNQVDYWVVIVGTKVIVHSSAQVFSAVKSNYATMELSKAISGFKGSHLFVSGIQIDKILNNKKI